MKLNKVVKSKKKLIKTLPFEEAEDKGDAGNLSMNRLFDDIVPLVEELRAGTGTMPMNIWRRLCDD